MAVQQQHCRPGPTPADEQPQVACIDHSSCEPIEHTDKSATERFARAEVAMVKTDRFQILLRNERALATR